MSDLRNKTIRLAHKNPSLRKDLLPLLQPRVVSAGTRESIADVMNIWFNQLGREMVKYESSIQIKKVTHIYIFFEANGKECSLEVNAVGGLDLHINDRKAQVFSMKDKAGEIIGTIVERYLR